VEWRCGGDDDIRPIIPTVQYLFSRDPAGIHGRSRSERTPLMLAAKRGADDVVRVLMKQGADVNAQDKDGLTGTRIRSLLTKIRSYPPKIDRDSSHTCR
jgi:ankyrin repeat protein